MAQAAAGAVIWRVLPAFRTRLLAHWTTGGTRLGRSGLWLFTGLSHALDREYYASTTSTTRREAIKALCMGKDSGVRWARQYLARGFPDRYTPALAMFAEIESRLASGTVGSVHQVACCSGREVAYFARRYPEVAFSASDTDPAIVDFLGEAWCELPNLSFTRLRLEETESAAMEALRVDLVYASGGLHYMDPEALARFMARVRVLAGTLMLSQPLDRSYAVGSERMSRPRRQLSWNHPYPYCLAQAGWERIAWSEGVVEELPALKNVYAAGDRAETG